MLRPLSLLARIGGGRQALRQERRRLRQAGDAARDSGDWARAASFYRDYVALAPKDAGLWVQLGHSLKEAARFDEARQAYDEALRLRPGDADVLLSLGHLAKLQGDLGEAARCYAASFTAGGKVHAREELSNPALDPHLPPEARKILHDEAQRAADALSARCGGLRIVDARAIALAGDGGYDIVGGETCIAFAADALPPDTPVAALLIHARAEDGAMPATGRLFIDFTDPSAPPGTISLRAGSVSPVVLLLPRHGDIARVRWHPDVRRNRLSIDGAELRPISDPAAVENLLRTHAEDGFDVDEAVRTVTGLFSGIHVTPADAVLLSKRLMPAGLDESFDYPLWLSRYVTPSAADYDRIAGMTAALARRPTFSFVVPVYNTPPDLLRQCLDSLLAQTYPDFEICIADDASPDPAVPALLDEYARRDPRIRWMRRVRNGHISAASNSALALARNEFVVLVDHDDTIPDYALFVVAWYIDRHPQGRIFFSDEDKISVAGELSAPYFKGEFNKFLMYGHNMVSHLGVYERALVEQVGGFRRGLEGSQDYDLFLRCYEHAGDKGVIHIPHVLYHWRTVPGSTSVASAEKSYAIVAAQAAINGHFERTNMPLRVGEGFAPGVTGIVPAFERDTSVSIIIPTRDGLDLLEPCIRSIDAYRYTDVELIVVDNGSVEPETLAFLDGLAARADTLVIRDDAPFNYSAINNAAAARARGDILCFLNNDTEVLAPNWIDRARGLLALPEVGAVGARLLYPDGTLQHFGIALGLAQHRVASTPHAGLPGDLPGYFGKARMIQEFSAVTGACLFMRAADFHAVGGFDPALRVAYNDVDLCLKVRARGLRILCDPEILLVHKESRTRGSDREGARADRLNAEAALMRERWGEVLDHDPYYSPNIALDRLDFALAFPPRVPLPWQEAAGD